MRAPKSFSRDKVARWPLPRRGNSRCFEEELERRLSLLLLPARPAPELRRRVLEAVKRASNA